MAVRETYADYANRAGGSQAVINYAQGGVRGFQNPNMQKTLDVTARFSGEWCEQLRAATKGSLKNAVDSVYNLRNLIAHGRSTGVTYARIKDYYDRIGSVIEIYSMTSVRESRISGFAKIARNL